MKKEQVAVKINKQHLQGLKKLFEDHSPAISRELFFVLEYATSTIEGYFIHCEDEIFQISNDVDNKWIINIYGLSDILNKEYPIGDKR